MSCESGIQPNPKRQVWNKDGSLDIGWWQINDARWQEKFKKMGLDITDPDQNLEAGFYLYSLYGVAPWKASNNCHKLLSQPTG